MSITPGRITRLVLDVPEPQILRPRHTERRRGAQIRRASTAADATANVRLLPGGGWSLTDLEEDITRIFTTTGNGNVIAGAGANMATGVKSVNTFRSPSDLTGIGVSGSVVSAGVPAFTKDVAAGASWNSVLTADATAFPGPTLPTTDIPMDRVVSGKTTYPENAGFIISYNSPGLVHPSDNILNFYFGGPTVTSTGAASGQYCLNVRGGGTATLYEQTGTDASGWKRRHSFRLSDKHQLEGAGSFWLAIRPYGRDCIAFFSVGVPDGGILGVAELLGNVATGGLSSSFYQVAPLSTGYRPNQFVTGAGTVRLDVRRDLRTFIHLVHLKPPASGVLVDMPFQVPHPIAAGTVLSIKAETFLPEGTSITGELYDASTNAALTPVTGGFASNAGQQFYYARFALASDADRKYSPVLYEYSVGVPVVYQDRAPTPITGGAIQQLSVTGPDLDPTHDSASLTIEDPHGQLATLRVRGRHRASVGVYNATTDALVSYLADGEVASASALYNGKTARAYPSTDWWTYDLSLVGVWSRLRDQVNRELLSFAVDENAAVDPQLNSRPPWKITSIIGELLDHAGFPSDTRDIPDIDLRLWSEGGNVEDYLLQPTQSYAEFIQNLARNYLGMVLCWDPNAGTRGKWRLLANPTSPYNVLATFVGAYATAGTLEMHTALTATTTAIQDGTYRERRVAPEGNYVEVVGVADALGGGGATRLTASMYNPVSFDYRSATSDPAHADYLGRFVPILHVDYSLRTPQAVQFVCRRIFDFACHAQKWATFTAPLLLVTDATDTHQTRPRPLRVNDAVTVLGATAIVRSCNPSYDTDRVQMAHYEVLYV